MSGTEEQEVLFEEYRRALAGNLLATAPDGLDSQLATLARKLATHLHASEPERAFVESLRLQLVGQAPQYPPAQDRAQQAGQRVRVTDRADRALATLPVYTSRPERHERGSAFFASANRFVAAFAYTVLLIVVGGGLALLLRDTGGSQHQEIVGAGSGSPTQAIPAVPALDQRPAIVRDEVVAAPYTWAIDGERVDRTPQLSPDGRYVAYLPQPRGQIVTRLVVRELDIGIERDLTPEPGFSYVSVRWAPNSRTLAFVKYRLDQGIALPAELWRIDADGQNLVQLYVSDPDAPPTNGPAIAVGGWSPDGRYISVGPTIWTRSARDRRMRVRADGMGAENPLALPTAVECGADEGTQVGQHQVIAPTEDYALCVVKTAGLRQPPEGAPMGGSSLVLYDYGTSQSRLLCAVPGLVSGQTISPNGDWIAFQVAPDPSTQGFPRLWVVRRDGTGLSEVAGDTYQLVQQGRLLWSTGGRAYFIALPTSFVNQSTGHVYALDAMTGTARMVTTDWRTPAIASVSQDGRRILVVRGTSEGGGIWYDAEIHLVELRAGDRAR